MPNWCLTTYVFHGEANEIKVFHDKLNEWITLAKERNEEYPYWLTHILKGAGLADAIDNPDPEKCIRCRGQITYIEELTEGDTTMDIDVETAWCPMTKIWQAVIDKLNLSIKFSFMAEEHGCGIYEVYDPEGFGDFRASQVWIEAEFEGTYNGIDADSLRDYYSIPEAIEELNTFFGRNFSTLEEFNPLIEKLLKENPEWDLSVNVFENITEYDY